VGKGRVEVEEEEEGEAGACKGTILFAIYCKLIPLSTISPSVTPISFAIT